MNILFLAKLRKLSLSCAIILLASSFLAAESSHALSCLFGRNGPLSCITRPLAYGIYHVAAESKGFSTNRSLGETLLSGIDHRLPQEFEKIFNLEDSVFEYDRNAYLQIPQLQTCSYNKLKLIFTDAESILDKSYCQENFPKDSSQIFDNNNDVSAYIINNWNERYIKSYFRTDKAAPFNLHTVFELNISAAKIWSQLVECNKHDSERARESYLTGKFNCEDSEKVNAKQIHSDIRELHQHIQQFMQTEIVDTSSDFQLETLHPLFIQIVMEYISVISASDFNPNQISDLKRVINKDDRIRKFLNSFQFLQYVPNKNCSSWGLWPSAGRSFVTAKQNQTNRIFNLIPNFRNRAKLNALFSCNFKAKLPDIYQKSESAITKQFQTLAKQYGLSEIEVPSILDEKECSVGESWDESLQECRDSNQD